MAPESPKAKLKSLEVTPETQKIVGITHTFKLAKTRSTNGDPIFCESLLPEITLSPVKRSCNSFFIGPTEVSQIQFFCVSDSDHRSLIAECEFL